MPLLAKDKPFEMYACQSDICYIFWTGNLKSLQLTEWIKHLDYAQVTYDVMFSQVNSYSPSHHYRIGKIFI